MRPLTQMLNPTLHFKSPTHTSTIKTDMSRRLFDATAAVHCWRGKDCAPCVAPAVQCPAAWARCRTEGLTLNPCPAHDASDVEVAIQVAPRFVPPLS